MLEQKIKKIVTLGGGSGHPVTLAALRQLLPLDIKAVVTTLDDGGSSGRLRKEFDIPPPGDIYHCVVALSEYGPILSDFFKKRFIKSAQLKGHSMGNILLTMLGQYCRDFKQGISCLEEVLEVKGRVLPVTYARATLVAQYQCGTIVKSEHKIDEPAAGQKLGRIEQLSIEPQVEADREVIRALKAADYIILGPGDFYTSILANVVVGKVAETIRTSRAKLIYISNIMTKKGQTEAMTTGDLASEIEKYCGRQPDVVIINKASVPEAIMKKYQAKGETLIVDNLSGNAPVKILADLLDRNQVKGCQGDNLERSLVRHDPRKLKRVLQKIIV